MKIVGVDLGTTNSVAAVYQGGNVTLIPNPASASKSPLCPSAVAFHRNEWWIGDQAARWNDPDFLASETKRIMGTSTAVSLSGQSFSPTEITSRLLARIFSYTSNYLEGEDGPPVQEAVITVPAYFTDPQKFATEKAGTLAGLQKVHLLSEPNAAALAYATLYSNRKSLSNKKMFVFDLGGGTLDVSLLECRAGKLRTKGVYGHNFLGGTDIDSAIKAHMIDFIKNEMGVTSMSDVSATRLTKLAEEVKIGLSSQENVYVPLDNIGQSQDGKIVTVDYHLSREKFEELSAVKVILRDIKAVLREVKKMHDDVDGSSLLYVGGSTYIPGVRRVVEEFFSFEEVLVHDPDTAVAKGAAIQAAFLDSEVSRREKPTMVLVDATAFSLGVGARMDNGDHVDVRHFSTIIPKNSPIPISQSKIYKLRRSNQRSVEIGIYQNKHNDLVPVDECELVQKMRISDIPVSKTGEPYGLNIKFSVSENNIFKGAATILGTDKHATVEIARSESILAEQDISKEREPLAKIDLSGLSRERFFQFVNGGNDILEDGDTDWALLELLHGLITGYHKAALDENEDELEILGGMIVEALHEYEREIGTA